MHWHLRTKKLKKEAWAKAVDAGCLTKALRNIKRKIEEIDSVVDLEDKSRQLRQYVQSGLAQFGTRKKRPYSQDQDDHHKQDSYFERVIHSVLNGWDVIKPRVREKTILDMIESHSDMCRIDKTALGDDCAVLIKCLDARRCFRFHDVPDLVKMAKEVARMSTKNATTVSHCARRSHSGQA